MATGSVQFRGIEAVINAFRDSDGSGWAIYDGRRLMFKNVGEDTLLEVMENLLQSASNSVYTLHIFEDITDRRHIKSNTEIDSSFNFRLAENDEFIPHNKYYRNGGSYYEDQRKEIEELKSKITELENEPEEPQEKSGL